MISRPYYEGEIERTDRRKIRDELIRRLRAMNLAFGQRVFSNRPFPFVIARLPACVVYTLREELEVDQESPRWYERRLEVAIELVHGVRPPADSATDLAQASDGLVEKIDELALEIEKRLERDQTLDGLVSDIRHKRFEYEPGETGEARFAFGRLIEEVTYRTEAPERPEGGFEPLREVRLTTQVGDSKSPQHAVHIPLDP